MNVRTIVNIFSDKWVPNLNELSENKKSFLKNEEGKTYIHILNFLDT